MSAEKTDSIRVKYVLPGGEELDGDVEMKVDAPDEISGDAPSGGQPLVLMTHELAIIHSELSLRMETYQDWVARNGTGDKVAFDAVMTKLRRLEPVVMHVDAIIGALTGRG